MIVWEGTLGGLAHLAVGSGTPLVYLPGASTEHRNPRGLGRRIAVRTLLPYAEAGFEVFLVQRRAGLPAGTTMADIAADYADAIRGRFDGPVAVLGHSTGGSTVLQLIADHPDVVDRAVVASAAHELGPLGKQVQRDWADQLERGRSGFEVLATTFTGNPAAQKLLAVPMRLLGALTKPEDPTDLIRVLRAEDDFALKDRLPGIATPTLVVGGARDRLYTPELFAETAEGMPNGRLTLYPKAGHGIAVKKDFFRDTIRFLTAART